MRTRALYLVIFILVWPFSQLPAWCQARTTSFSTAEINGEYLIFMSHALDLENIWLNQEQLSDYDSQDAWVYGIALGLPIRKKTEIRFSLYGPFWSIWPIEAKPTALELQTKFPLYRKGADCVSIAPAYVSTWIKDLYSFNRYVEIYEWSTKGFRFPIIYSNRTDPRNEVSAIFEFNIDWMQNKGIEYDGSTGDYVRFTSKPTPIVHGGVGFVLKHHIRAATTNFELGIQVYEGSNGKIQGQITYGAALGTVW